MFQRLPPPVDAIFMPDSRDAFMTRALRRALCEHFAAYLHTPFFIMLTPLYVTPSAMPRV